MTKPNGRSEPVLTPPSRSDMSWLPDCTLKRSLVEKIRRAAAKSNRHNTFGAKSNLAARPSHFYRNTYLLIRNILE
jgi:hypothetical protein